MRELLITTGHNSSAILLEDGRIQWGYETERITGVKSDSRFPLEHLERHGIQIGKIDMAYVTHWSPNGDLRSVKEKYWQPNPWLLGVPIASHSTDLTHHDTHVHGALAYAGPNFPKQDAYAIVIDGFGTFGEHFSIYSLTSGTPSLVRRIHGYGTSLGLWYQYATAFMNMKMHEDEYKLLGYEVHVSADDAEAIFLLAQDRSDEWVDDMYKSVYGSKYDPMYDVSALGNVRNKIFAELTAFCDMFEITEVDSLESRALIARFVQEVLEQVVIKMIAPYRPKHLLLSGGVFYNVKLNKRLLDSIDGYLCVYPLAGDQGNSLGLYAAHRPSWTAPTDLLWGKRALTDCNAPNVLSGSEAEIVDFLSNKLRTVGYVNLVRGAMEFGPRALCNTSTLALPTIENVAAINAMNDRNTVMPMAPVMQRRTYNQLFENSNRVWRSEEHMILAMEYAEYPMDSYLGVAHDYRWPRHYQTGRPQVVDRNDSVMNALLDEFTILINTSFNYHGMPIALGMDSIVKNHMMQWQRNDRIHTGVIRND